MRKSGKKVWLILTALMLLAAAAAGALFLREQRVMALAREDAVTELFCRDVMSVGNDEVHLSLAEIEAGEENYSLSYEETGKVTISDMEQAVIALPGNASDADITVYSGEEAVFAGKAEQFRFFYPENGTYRLEAVCYVEGSTVTTKGEELRAEGTERYSAQLEYAIPMRISFQTDHIKEGSVITVTGSGVRGEVIISAGEVAAPFPLVTDSRGYAKGLFSVSYITPPGTYSGIIETREGVEEFTFTVVEEEYTVQHLIISEETQSSTIGSSDNRDAYNAMIDVTYDSWFPTRFYDDCFTQPVDGVVTTEFGLFRYTNDNPVPTRHAGVDIADDEGTPVLAAASGYVIAAGYNGVSGFTVVIDHGFGVRTYYFHMAELSVEQGKFVEEGTEIGKVGSTGYATGPHLHFNVMVHDNSVDPWATFNGTSGIFGLDMEA